MQDERTNMNAEIVLSKYRLMGWKEEQLKAVRLLLEHNKPLALLEQHPEWDGPKMYEVALILIRNLPRWLLQDPNIDAASLMEQRRMHEDRVTV